MTSFGDLMARTDLSLYSQLIEVEGPRMIQKRVQEKLQLYGAWLYGGCQMASFIWDRLEDNGVDETQEVSDKLAKYCILRTSYTFLRMHPDFSPDIGDGEDRRSFYEDLVYPIIYSWWPSDLERAKVFNEYLVLDTQYSYDLQNDRSRIESQLFYTQIMNMLKSDLSLDITEVEVPIRDVIDLIGSSGVLTLGIADRLIISGAVGFGMDAAVSTLRDWPNNWIYPGTIPPNLFEPQAGDADSRSVPSENYVSIEDYARQKAESSNQTVKEHITRSQRIGITRDNAELKHSVSKEESLKILKEGLLEILKSIEPRGFETASDALGHDFLNLTPHQAGIINHEGRKTLFINTILKMDEIDYKAILSSFNESDLESALSSESLAPHTESESEKLGELPDMVREIIGNTQSPDQEIGEPEETGELHSPNLEEDQLKENLETKYSDSEEDQRQGVVQPPSTPEISTLCLECGNDNPLEAKYCIYSGHRLPLLICPKCRTKNIPEAKFCMECGEGR